MAQRNMSPTKCPMPSLAPDYRNKVFEEVATGYTYEMAVEEARRCLHCKNKPCVTACPVGCLYKDPATGLTRYDTTHCIGCHSCAMACPYGAPTFRPTGEGRPREKMEKCHGCLERIQAGLQPACVHSCPTGALTWRWAEDGESSALSQLYQSWTALRPADRKK